MNDLDKQKAIRLARQLGLKVEFTNKEGIFVKQGNIEKELKWEDIFPELGTIK